MLKNQLELLQQEFTSLKEKIKTKLQALQGKCDETNRELELQRKDNQENEAVLEQLLKEFKELEAELN